MVESREYEKDHMIREDMLRGSDYVVESILNYRQSPFKSNEDHDIICKLCISILKYMLKFFVQLLEIEKADYLLEIYFDAMKLIFDYKNAFYQDEEIGDYKHHKKFTKNDTWRNKLRVGLKVMVYEMPDTYNLIAFAEDTSPLLYGW